MPEPVTLDAPLLSARPGRLCKMDLSLDGRRAYAYTGGKPFDPALPCVVFIHGAINDHSVWGLQARSFAHRAHGVLAVDLPGHGRSEGPALGSVEALADWIVALLDAAGVKRAALVGHSMGSLIALEAAARLGERASQCVMVATAYPMKVSAELLQTAAETPLKAMDMVTGFSLSTLAAKPSAPGPGTWLHGANRALMRRLQTVHTDAGHGNLFLHDFNVCNDYANAAEAAVRVVCPVSFVLGAKDQMTMPRAAGELGRWLKARIVTLPTGHALMQESPDGLLKALTGILA